jgi:hypothetical protein
MIIVFGAAVVGTALRVNESATAFAPVAAFLFNRGSGIASGAGFTTGRGAS